MVDRRGSSAVFWGVRGAKSLESRTSEVAGVIVALAKRAEPYAGVATARDQEPAVLRDALETLRMQHEELLVADEELRAQLEEFQSLEETVQTERARTELIFLHAPDAYVLTDDAGVVGECNLAASRLFGMSEQHLCGKPLAALVHKDDVAKFRSLVGTPAQEPVDVPMRVLSRSQSAPISTAVIVASSNENTTFFWRFRIVRNEPTRNATSADTESLTLERARRAEEQRSSVAKDRLIALVSHDMRAPLNSIIGWTALLREPNFDEAMRPKALATIERNARAQASLIEDLLDISRITLGKLRIELKALELTAVLRAALDAARPTIQARGIGLTFALPDEKIEVLGDRDRLQQLLGNLLGNAIKFTPMGGQISVELKSTGTHAIVSVADTGRGIELAMLASIFDCFEQADTTSANDGLGLGLYISRQMAELHRGSLLAQSEGEGQGSVFTLTLPLLESREHPDGDTTLTLPLPSWTTQTLARLNVLVVDDDPDARELAGLMLRKAGAKVVLASSVASALDTFDVFQPDVVVSDIRMEGSDGNDLVRALRQSKHASVPALAVSGSATDSDARRAIESGFDAYLVKPVPAQTLIEAVAKAAALGRA